MPELTREDLQMILAEAIAASGIVTALEKIDRVDRIVSGNNGTPGLVTQVALLTQSLEQVKEQGKKVETFMVSNEADRRKIMGMLQEMEISQFESSSNLRSETEGLEVAVEEINKKLNPLVEWRQNIAMWVLKGGAITAGVSFVFGSVAMFVLNYMGVIKAAWKILQEAPK